MYSLDRLEDCIVDRLDIVELDLSQEPDDATLHACAVLLAPLLREPVEGVFRALRGMRDGWVALHRRAN